MSTPETDGRRTAAAARRRQREADIIAATRALFDQKGVRDAQIDQIAQAVGVNRAIVYRHFTGKEELFALTLVEYLDELSGGADRGRRARARPRRPARPDHRGVRRLRHRPPGVRRLRADPDASHRARAAWRRCRSRRSSGSAGRSPRAWRCWSRPSSPGSRPVTSPSRTRRCWPTCSTPAGSAHCSWPASGSWSRSPPPAYRPSARSHPSRSATT